MIKFHGWLVVLAHWDPLREDDFDMLEVGKIIRSQLPKLNAVHNINLEVYNTNGIDQITIVGCNNKIRSEYISIAKFFKSVLRKAPGSYGVISYINDELTNVTERDMYFSYIIRKEQVIKVVEPYFSPYCEKIGE